MANLVDLVAPKAKSTVLIYDVHASESGALAILDDLYRQINDYQDKSVRWIFAVSTPDYKTSENIIVNRFPWVKKNWGYRLYFDNITTRKILKKYKPDIVFSLQNKGIDYFHGMQLVYLHLPFVLTDHQFRLRTDGMKLWLYQNVISKSIFKSLRKVDMTIVQTQWMKESLIEKAHIKKENIVVQQPDISCNEIGKYIDTPENRKRLFYPATAFTYKNHMTLLKSLKIIQELGLSGFELILTINENENKYTKDLYDYARMYSLNVSFLGPIPRKKVFELYTKSVLVFPSYVESFGLPLLEAKMTGAPVIASDCAFSREILRDYSKASYFVPNNEVELAELIKKRSIDEFLYEGKDKEFC